jgi:hypothetical protein
LWAHAMSQSRNEFNQQEAWTLQADEYPLLPGMTDKGRLGFALQLKFRQIYGRNPENIGEIDPDAMQWVSDQVGVSATTLLAYELDSRQGQRHRQIIRSHFGYRLPGRGSKPKPSKFPADLDSLSYL